MSLFHKQYGTWFSVMLPDVEERSLLMKLAIWYAYFLEIGDPIFCAHTFRWKGWCHKSLAARRKIADSLSLLAPWAGASELAKKGGGQSRFISILSMVLLKSILVLQLCASYPGWFGHFKCLRNAPWFGSGISAPTWNVAHVCVCSVSCWSWNARTKDNVHF